MHPSNKKAISFWHSTPRKQTHNLKNSVQIASIQLRTFLYFTWRLLKPDELRVAIYIYNISIYIHMFLHVQIKCKNYTGMNLLEAFGLAGHRSHSIIVWSPSSSVCLSLKLWVIRWYRLVNIIIKYVSCVQPFTLFMQVAFFRRLLSYEPHACLRRGNKNHVESCWWVCW